MARRPLLLLLAALLLVAAAAPGAHAAEAQNRVGAFLSAAPTHTGPQPAKTPSPHRATTTPSRPIAAGCCVAAKAGRGGGAGGAPSRRFVSTPRGTTFDVPGGWASRTADNGRGIVYQRPGAAGNADSIRIMEPTQKYPGGYFRYYNKAGQPLDVNGKPGPPSATHIPEEYIGRIPGWPR